VSTLYGREGGGVVHKAEPCEDGAPWCHALPGAGRSPPPARSLGRLPSAARRQSRPQAQVM
jgi:hypothetical protein